jgi:2-polyprenyl-3-methyl-5-hydroxy-6-metoxy-1,4-benzoquinol methylase
LTDCLCPLCRSSRCEIAEHAEPPYRVVRCSDCDLVYVDPIPDVGELSLHYNQDYYAEWISSQRKKRERMWGRRLKSIENQITGGDILDVGCGDGLFLEMAQQNGWGGYGTDVSAYATGFASKRIGQNVFCGEIWDAGFNEQSFDVITLWHVLEHTTSPMRTLQEVRKVLKPDGLLVLAVPNLNDRLMQAAYRLVKGRKPRLFSIGDKEVHLFHFSVRSLKLLLEKTGFTCVKVGPDFGVVELSKQLINNVAAVLFYSMGVHWYNSIQVFARRVSP